MQHPAQSCIKYVVIVFVFVFQYGMVIDAGSSHTTVFTYQFPIPFTGEVKEMSNFTASGEHRSHSIETMTLE